MVFILAVLKVLSSNSNAVVRKGNGKVVLVLN